MHLNLFGLYQTTDFDQVPGSQHEEQGYPRDRPDDGRLPNNSEAMMWEQAHRRNYVIVEEE